MIPRDYEQRIQAINPQDSFIVQAPAGSGKTEILTQRFLNLLSKVKQPEEIVALTFTKKAANEMRERIVHALEKANSNITPILKHQVITNQLAKKAIKHSQRLSWNILENPSRLKIITIDALCQTITNAIFLEDNKSAFTSIADNPKQLYLEAAQECIHYAAENTIYNELLKNLLNHLDNRQERLLSLFTDLLAKREQWLNLLYQAKLQSKEEFERAISWIESNEIYRFQNTINDILSSELINLIQRLIQAVPTLKPKLEELTSLDKLNVKLANELANLLLTSNNTLRKSFDHHIGLTSKCCDPKEYKYLKETSKNILTELNNNSEFVTALQRIKNLPSPVYDSNDWKILQTILNLLPLLVAHLEILFNKYNMIDFTGVSNQALISLGDEQNPTDLALYLDNKIKHILVDEFQDTSISQFQLLTMLVQEWEPFDNRTIFVVGDPQQSIYKFRGAEVGLFIKARKHGIGSVKLKPLELTANFRSDKKIVNWVNTNFQTIFPKEDNIRAGAIKQFISHATNESNDNCYIKTLQFTNEQEEAKAIIDIMQQELKLNPQASIAILARQRSQLSAIMHEIRKNNLQFQGVDIESLSNLPHIQDIYSLTRAILMPADRLYWLAFLRSPFCGISLEDLHIIANYTPNQSILFALSQLENIENLSSNGLIRAKFIYTLIQKSLDNRHQKPIVNWILDILQELNINSVLSTSEQEDLEQYWQLLEKFTSNESLPNWRLFDDELVQLYSKNSNSSNINIMTIHKSKGLEFDCVIIPSLSSKTNNHTSDLFRILHLPTDDKKDILLFSPIKASDQDTNNLYNYIKKIDDEKDSYELQRLLYVAVTRAKKRLYLTDNQEKSSSNSFRHMLNHLEFIKINNNEVNNSEKLLPKLYRLPIEFYNVEKINNDIEKNNTKKIPIGVERQLGIVKHELLQWICNNHPENTEKLPWQLVYNLLRSKGFNDTNLDKIINDIKQQIHNLYQDPIGRWIISKQKQEKNEYELLQLANNKVNTKIIDRTFVENNYLWIIDFKTGKVDSELENKYKKQLNEYAKILYNPNFKIKCGLYYLQNNIWNSWEYCQDLTHLTQHSIF